MTKNNKGFSIIEIIIIVVIIVILSSLTVFAYSKIQKDSRNSQREARMTVLASALDKYRSEKGVFPSCDDMKKDGAYITQNVLIGLDPVNLLVPTSTAGVTNSITTCENLTAGDGQDEYAYVDPYKCLPCECTMECKEACLNGSTDPDDIAHCDYWCCAAYEYEGYLWGYRLEWRDENTGEIKSFQSSEQWW